MDKPAPQDFVALHNMLETLTHLCTMEVMSSDNYLKAHTAINDELIVWRMREANERISNGPSHE